MWLAIAALLVGRSLWAPGDVAREVASASTIVDAELVGLTPQPSSENRLEPAYAFRNIENLRVGDRVVADNPDLDTPEQTAVDPDTWRLYRLYAEEVWANGTVDTIHIQTLQPPAWAEAVGARPGAHVPPPLDLVEMGLPEALETTVLDERPCPALEEGPGRVVLTTVNHLNDDVWRLTAVSSSGRQEELRPTGFHKFYSETRGDWVSTKDIHDNEVIRGRAGPLTVVAKTQLPGTHRVYNLTVEGEHVYYVSHNALLTHNNGCATEVLFGQKRIAPTFRRDGPNSSIAGRRLVDVAEDLRLGKLTSDDIEIFAFRHPETGELIAESNRGLAALTMAGLRPTRITMINTPSGKALKRLTEQLQSIASTLFLVGELQLQNKKVVLGISIQCSYQSSN